MSYPAFVQWAAAVAADGDDRQHGQLIVRYDGVPEIVDLLELAEWAALRSELIRWEMTVGEVGGVLAIGNRQPVEATVRAWNDEATPTLAILDSLASDGWVRGEPPKVHDSASTKQFCVKDPVREKAYLQCLAALPHLLNEFDMEGLRSDQRRSYYSVLLRVDEPSVVLLDAAEQVYLAMLKGVSQHGQLLALENAERQDRSSSDEAEDVIILGAKARGPATQPKAKGKPYRLMKRQNVRDWTKLLCPSLAQGDQPLHLEEKRSVASVAFAVAPRTAHASSSSSSGQNGQQTMELASAAGGSIECINHDGQQEARVDTLVGAATSSGQLGEVHPPAPLSHPLDAT